MNLSHDAVVFCLVSFEGPDPYSLAGGLGVRITNLAETLAARGYDLPLPALTSTWAGSGGMEFFAGDPARQAVFQLMIQAYNKALLTANQELADLALWLAQSDNLHLIQWLGRSGSEAEVSASFTPQEWGPLGPDRIIRKIQQIYKNFIAALDTYIPSVQDRERSMVR